MSKFQLFNEIIQLSEAGAWEQARLEWVLAEVYEAEEPETCLCGHFPIIELCVLVNRQNMNTAIVGNICVKKFIGLPSDRIFQAVKRIRKDNSKSLNSEAIQHAYERRWINEWERDFYFDVMSKRKLSEKQETKKLSINALVLTRMKKHKPSSSIT